MDCSCRVAARRAQWLLALAVVVAAAASLPAQQPPTPDEQAAMVLDSARRAFNEKNLPFATQRFREFLAAYGGHKDAPAARLGLALSLLEQPNRNYQEIIDTLRPAAENGGFADRGFALQHVGWAYRALGHAALSLATARPNEAPQHQQVATQQFTEALKWFQQAEQVFRAKAGDLSMLAAEAPLPGDFEWANRARCDQLEMLLRLNRVAEVPPLAEPFFKTAPFPRSQYRLLATYYAGHAAYLQKDFPNAGRLLSQLAPFDNPAYGVHARYLLARVHHLAGEREEALALYAGLVTDYDAQVAAAKQALANPALLNDKPEEKLRYEQLATLPAPDYVARAVFYAGVLLFEQEKFVEAQERFALVAKQFPTSPLLAEAQLRLGFCQVQLKQPAEALKTLLPLQEHAVLADQARWWLARAQVAVADPANPQAYVQSLNAAIEFYRRAAEKAGQLQSAEPAAKLRKHDQLIELGDTQQLAKMFKEAAATYQLVLADQPDPIRAELSQQRQVGAFHLAGMYKESDDAVARFVAAFPQSTLLPAVLFRHAGNALAVAEATAATPNLPNRDQALLPLYTEAIKRFSALLEKHPEFEQAQVARFSLGLAKYRLGQFAEAIETLTAIPEADRAGELSPVAYVLADCLLRTAPPNADDAIAAGRLLQQVNQAAKLLDGFVAANPAGPLTPDALLKLGQSHQRAAETIVEPQERAAALNLARQAYEKVMNQFAAAPALPVAVMERARVIALQGDLGTATNELNRFTADPLAAAPIAPTALLHLATLLRAQNRAADAATMLANGRGRHEAALLQDPQRAELAPLLQYHQGLALKEAGKVPEALAIFDASAKQFAGKPSFVDAAWRCGQCKSELAHAKFVAAQALLNKPGATAAEVMAAQQPLAEALTALREAAAYFEAQIGPAGQVASGSEGHLRMFYEAAWVQRTLAGVEIAAVRKQLQADAHKKLQEEAAKATPAGQPVPSVNPPDIPLAAVPLQPGESKARELYKSLISASASAPLAIVARLELAEVLSERAELDPAIALLVEGIDLEPPAEVSERLRLRLGSCLLAKNDPAGAAAEFAAVASSTDPTRAADARFRTGEALILKQDYPAAIAQLVVFRDQDPWRNIAGINERAILRLANAYALSAQWEPSRQAAEQFLQRFPQSPFVEEARYAMAWAQQNLSQFDAAVNTYIQVTRNTTSEVAARAQLQIGLCKLAQSKFDEAAAALLVVPYTYDYPRHNALALCEAARAFVQLKRPEHARTLLERVVKDYATSPLAEQAKARLAEIK